MLVLSRKPGESIIADYDGELIIITVHDVDQGVVKLELDLHPAFPVALEEGGCNVNQGGIDAAIPKPRGKKGDPRKSR